MKALLIITGALIALIWHTPLTIIIGCALMLGGWGLLERKEGRG